MLISLIHSDGYVMSRVSAARGVRLSRDWRRVRITPGATLLNGVRAYVRVTRSREPNARASAILGRDICGDVLLEDPGARSAMRAYLVDTVEGREGAGTTIVASLCAIPRE